MPASYRSRDPCTRTLLISSVNLTQSPADKHIPTPLKNKRAGMAYDQHLEMWEFFLCLNINGWIHASRAVGVQILDGPNQIAQCVDDPECLLASTSRTRKIPTMLCFRGADATLLLWPPRVAVGLLHRTENRRIAWTQGSLLNTIPSEKHIHSVYPPNQAPAQAAQTLTTGDIAAIGK